MASTVFFTGHMIDRSNRALQRFPVSLIPHIGQRIATELETLGASDGFSSGACGGDILFLEAMLARGGRIHIVLPCSVQAFRHDCVDVIPGADWGARFDKLMAAASSVDVLGEEYASDNAMASECCSRIIAGLARLRAAQDSEQAVLLALWDGRPGDAFGGTQSFVQFCVQQGYCVRWMTDLVSGENDKTRELTPLKAGSSSAVQRQTAGVEAPQQICAAVFADAVGFSKLTERQIPLFATHYLDCAMRALQSAKAVPLAKNTWGDGLYLVFDSMREAGLFALDFRDNVLNVPWLTLGFKEKMSVRIGIHAGPVFRIYDPMFGQWTYTGSHVTRAARLEPSTDPGKAFGSLAFAALAAAERAAEFACRAAGRRALVKGAGEMRVYELVRRDEPAPREPIT
jgi:class 3 adenylate cyclase